MGQPAPRQLVRQFLFAVLFCLSFAMPGGARADDARADYRAALAHLAAGRVAEFETLRRRLADYVLHPYLDYHQLSRSLDRVTDAQMHAFRQAHDDLPVARSLYARWLRRAADARDWPRLAANPPDRDDAAARCMHLRARLTVAPDARPAVMAEVAPLWSVGRSQPAACDPLFDAWIAGGGVTETIAWERLTRAIENNEAALARYLLRFFAGSARVAAETLLDVHTEPSRVLDTGRFATDSPTTRQTLRHGLERLAAGAPARAEVAWAGYRTRYDFDTASITSISSAILLGHSRAGSIPTAWPEADLAAPDGTAAALAQAAVNRQQWDTARYWIGHLTPATRAETRWRYWLARALEADPGTRAEATAHYRAIAAERDYYGFLAAHRIGTDTRLNAAPHQHDPAIEHELRARVAVRRALELEAVGDTTNARREWHQLLGQLSVAEQVHAAHLVQQSGAIAQSIQIANAAMLRDHVDLRFPVAFPDLFAAVSSTTAVPKPFLLAIARQESLFDPDARSSANARGVMQLLPGTATHVARQDRLALPAVADLHRPAVNVELGGRHLARLLRRYGDRRPLVAAAYNAGEGRVDRWIRDRAGEPMDVWIETIPFGETRNYVKNVIAFTQVYGHLLGTPVPVLTPAELVVP